MSDSSIEITHSSMSAEKPSPVAGSKGMSGPPLIESVKSVAEGMDRLSLESGDAPLVESQCLAPLERLPCHVGVTVRPGLEVGDLRERQVQALAKSPLG